MRVIVADDRFSLEPASSASSARSAATSWPRRATVSRRWQRCVFTGRTRQSSTSGCRRPTRTKAWSPHTRIRPAFPELGSRSVAVRRAAYAMRLIETYPGGLGYLLKERVLDPAVLLDALRRLVDGECVIDPTIVARFMHPKREPDPLDVLTDANEEVFGPAGRRSIELGDRRRHSSSRSGRSDRTRPRSSRSSGWRPRRNPSARVGGAHVPAVGTNRGLTVRQGSRRRFACLAKRNSNPHRLP